MLRILTWCFCLFVLLSSSAHARCPEHMVRALDHLRERDPIAEARQNFDRGDLRPMGYYNAGPAGVLPPKARGLRCPDPEFKFREQFGSAADGIPQCLVEPLKRAEKFAESYNRELDKAARKRGQNVCATGTKKQINFVTDP